MPLKVMVFNVAVGKDQQPGETWTSKDVSVVASHPILRSATAEGVTDSDVFVASGSLEHNSGHTVNITERVSERVAAGGLLICFVDGPVVSWLPMQRGHHVIEPRPVPGHDVSTTNLPSMEALAKAIEKESAFTIELLPNNTLSDQQHWRALARAKDRAAVAALYVWEAGRVLLLPPMVKTRQRVVRLILDKIVPEILPSLGHGREKGNEEPPPDWSLAVPVPGLEEKEASIADLRDQMDRSRRDLETRERELDGLLRYRGLLWMTGDELEEVVRESLGLLGIAAEKRDPIDGVVDLGAGRLLYIEMEGSEGATTVRKGRQLLGYIAEAEDPAQVSGAIIANPHRKSPPEQRTTVAAPLFSKELDSLAKKQDWPLIQTKQLFDLVCRFLGGNEKEKELARAEARRLLGID